MVKRLVALVLLFALVWPAIGQTPLHAGLSDEQGQASRVPWSGWWWPLLDSRNPNLYDDGGPLEKYDAYFEELGWGNPGTEYWEYENHRTDDPENTWWGHCHAWAAASVIEPEPIAAGYDAGIYFTVGDLKGLLTESYYTPSSTDSYGTRYNGEGGDDYDDMYPDLFHQVVLHYIGQQRKAVVADIDASEQVWNYPLYRYEFEYTEDSQYSNVTHVYAKIYYADDAVKADFVGVEPLVKEYTYWLQTQGNQIVDGGWEGDSTEDHPDFIWVPDGRDPDGTPVDLNVVKAILVPRPVNGCNEYLGNGGFDEEEIAPWVALGQTEVSGDDDWYVWLGGYDEADDILYQTVAIPSATSAATLSYSWAMTTDEEEHSYDFLKVTVRDATNGTVLRELETISDGSQADTWVDSTFDLRAYAGKTIQIHFAATTDDSNATSFYLNDVQFSVCSGVQPTPPVQPTPTPTLGPAPVGCRDAVANGGFESGDFDGWDSGNMWTNTDFQPEITSDYSHAGDYSAWLGGYADADDAIWQYVSLPTQPSRALLSYWWWMETDEEDDHGFDYLYVQILDEDDNALATLQEVHDGASSGQWTSAVFDVSAFQGRRIQVVFVVTGDDSNVTSFYIDDVKLEICGGPTPTPRARVFLPVMLRQHRR